MEYSSLMDERFNELLRKLRVMRVDAELNGHSYMPQSHLRVIFCLHEAVETMEKEEEWVKKNYRPRKLSDIS